MCHRLDFLLRDGTSKPHTENKSVWGLKKISIVEEKKFKGEKMFMNRSFNFWIASVLVILLISCAPQEVKTAMPSSVK
jgi:hypothetical protein